MNYPAQVDIDTILTNVELDDTGDWGTLYNAKITFRQNHDEYDTLVSLYYRPHPNDATRYVIHKNSALSLLQKYKLMLYKYPQGHYTSQPVQAFITTLSARSANAINPTIVELNPVESRILILCGTRKHCMSYIAERNLIHNGPSCRNFEDLSFQQDLTCAMATIGDTPQLPDGVAAAVPDHHPPRYGRVLLL